MTPPIPGESCLICFPKFFHTCKHFPAASLRLLLRQLVFTQPLVLFGIPWTAFSIFWIVGASWGTSKSGHPLLLGLFPLFGLPFVLIGFGMLSSPYWIRRKARRTAYVITDRRAIILSAGWGKSITVRSFAPESMTDLKRTQNADGSGNLIFAQDLRRGSEGNRYATDVGFIAVRDVKSVEDRIRSISPHNDNEVTG